MASHFFGTKSHVKFEQGSFTKELVYDGRPRGGKGSGKLIVYYHTALWGKNVGMGNASIGAKVDLSGTFNIGEEPLFQSFNETLELLQMESLRPEKIFEKKSVWEKDLGKLVFIERDYEIDTHHIADGVRTIHNLRIFFNLVAKTLSSLPTTTLNRMDGSVANFVIIEEPETNLHPKFQKAIPQLLQGFIDGLGSGIRDKTFILVTTHSPFIISATTKFPDQKIYPIANGGLVVIDSQKQEWKESNNSAGYKGHEVSYVVGQMLGGEITDLGYPENYCILEEYSLQLILDYVKEKGFIRNIQFVSASGIDNVPNLTDRANQIISLNTLIKCNPYYFDKYCVIVDNYDGKSAKLNNLKEKLGNRFIELSCSTLEEYYVNLDSEIHKDAVERISKATSHTEKGLIKADSAKQIAKLIRTPQDFSKLFKNELDEFLLE